MRRWSRFFYCILSLVAAASARADDLAPESIDFKTYQAPLCSAPTVDLGLRPEEAQAWSACEKWVWFCIRQGKEANLFIKQCTDPRPGKEDRNWRTPFRLAPFYEPDRYQTSNALGDGFLRTILSNATYSSQMQPTGIRIFGGYFANHVNFENIATTHNVVIDSSVFKHGIRFSNYETTKNVSLDGSNVRETTLMFRARVAGTLFMQQGVYDAVDLRDARIGSSFDAEGSVFNDELRIDRARIEGKINLSKTRLTVFNAWSAQIEGYVEMRLADIRLQMDMTGATVGGDVRLPRVTFGRRIPDGTPKCDWDPATEIQSIFHDLVESFRDEPENQARVLQEINGSRGSGKNGRMEDDVCVTREAAKKRYRSSELLLRDMKVGGLLCLIDVTGEIPVKGSDKPASIATISLDGTHASSTVFRWRRDSQSTTLWHAVNFQTDFLLVNPQDRPKRLFLDNLKVGFLSLVKSDPFVSKQDPGDPDFDKFLCDVTPETENKLSLDERSAQSRIIEFFKANESESAQPFAEVVERLESSGVASTYLKRELSAYQYRDACSSSLFIKHWPRFPRALRQKRQELPWLQTWQAVKAALYDVAMEDTAEQSVRPAGSMLPSDVSAIDELRKLGLDGLCSVWLPVYATTTSYGHEPHNLFYFVVGFILLFWLLLQLDSRPEGLLPKRRLGLWYAIDTFIPDVLLQRNTRQDLPLPNRRWLQAYLKLHQAIGFILSIAIFLLVFKAL